MGDPGGELADGGQLLGPQQFLLGAHQFDIFCIQFGGPFVNLLLQHAIKAVELLFIVAQSFSHVFEAGGQTADFVIVGFRQGDVPFAGGQLLGRLLKLGNRQSDAPGNVTGEKVATAAAE